MNQLDIKDLSLEGAKIIERKMHEDERGYLTRIFCLDELKSTQVFDKIKQINITFTKSKGTIRGLHYQSYPYAETKIVSCIKGEIFDVIVDLRKESTTFLKVHTVILSKKNQKSLLIPKGFAHGFQSLEDNCELLYFHSENYNPEYENGILYNDKKLNIKWPLSKSIISKRDHKLPLILNSFKGLEV
tara:strand:- start:940 stop:1500 length:561 start_codon:yes stop_codon:yes gene_type:complete